MFCHGVNARCLSVLVTQKAAMCTTKDKGWCSNVHSLLQVRVKSVVDFVSEVLSHTVKERCMKQSVAAACTAAAAQVHAEADEKLQPELETGAGLTADNLRSHLQASVDRLLSGASAQVGGARQDGRAGGTSHCHLDTWVAPCTLSTAGHVAWLGV